jgi:hypothetical protein
MNKTKQFWALLKFQAVLSPLRALILMPLAMTASNYIPSFFSRSVHGYHPGLDQMLSNQNLFLVGFFGVMLLAPEVMRTEATRAQWPTGTEFVLTRAVDRPMVFRARAALFYLFIVALPLCALPFAVANPSLQVNEYNEAAHQLILDKLTGSIPAQTIGNLKSHEITIPNGNMLIGSWRIWTILSVAIVVQLFFLAIYPLKYRLAVLTVAFFAVIGLPLFITLRLISRSDVPSFNEPMFFIFTAHQAMAWVLTIVAIFLGQVWCERRFAGLEQ